MTRALAMVLLADAVRCASRHTEQIQKRGCDLRFALQGSDWLRVESALRDYDLAELLEEQERSEGVERTVGE